MYCYIHSSALLCLDDSDGDILIRSSYKHQQLSAEHQYNGKSGFMSDNSIVYFDGFDDSFCKIGFRFIPGEKVELLSPFTFLGIYSIV